MIRANELLIQASSDVLGRSDREAIAIEIDEMKEEVKKNNLKKIKEEIGDGIFSIINYARFIGIDPEEALDKTNNKFITRFSWMEKTIRLDGKSIKKMSLEEMDKYWERSKKT